jgi:hypothetical protein
LLANARSFGDPPAKSAGDARVASGDYGADAHPIAPTVETLTAVAMTLIAKSATNV